MTCITDMSEGVLRELADFVLGDRLGEGMSRVTYSHPEDAAVVIKVENHSKCFQNVMEWQTWQWAKECKEIARWLAPCYAISHSGTFLIMARTLDLPPSKIPEKLPAFLTDHKLENYGLYKGRVVCRDYGHIIQTLSTALRKWRGER